jgi:hypothetical protein
LIKTSAVATRDDAGCIKIPDAQKTLSARHWAECTSGGAALPAGALQLSPGATFKRGVPAMRKG